VAESEVPRLRDVLDHVIDSSLFATESRVARYAEEYPYGSGLFSRRTAVGTVQAWRQALRREQRRKAIRGTAATALYGSTASRGITRRYRLHSSLRVSRAGLDEVKIALACVTFECLRHNWAVLDGLSLHRRRVQEQDSDGSKSRAKRQSATAPSEMFMQVGVLQVPAERRRSGLSA